MCRLMGFSLGNEGEELSPLIISLRMFPYMIRQGPHAYGWMSWKPGDEITYFKSEGRADSPTGRHAMIREIDGDAKWFVGHTRFATHGSPKNMNNNHPLDHGRIIGVHNGKLRNHEDILSVTGREREDTQVDSEAIFAAVDRWGPSRGLRKLAGSFVTIYSNVDRPHVLHIARSSGRQLHLGWTERGSLFWSSDEYVLLALEPEIKFVKFSSIRENRLLIVRDGKIIQRHQFAPPLPPLLPALPPAARLYTPPPSTIRVPMHTAQDSRANPVFERAIDRASRRGEILFPKGKRHLHRTPRQNEKTYVLDGVVMTYEEYQDAIGEDFF